MSKRKPPKPPAPPKRPESGALYYEDMTEAERAEITAEISADYEAAMARIAALPPPTPAERREMDRLFPPPRPVLWVDNTRAKAKPKEP